MKYWGYLMAKLAAAAGVSTLLFLGLRTLVFAQFPVRTDNLRFDFAWACAQFGWFLLTSGLVWAAVLDQRHRCRACCRRLRMPLSRGAWDKAILFSRPQLEWICPYGHGTMNEPQVQLLGREVPHWDAHDEDIWKELESIGAGRSQRD
jgi:hypothetical protein